jgi:hypothetical protein
MISTILGLELVSGDDGLVQAANMKIGRKTEKEPI